MPSKIEWLHNPDGKMGETINPFGWGCYGPTGTVDHPQLCSYCFAKRLSIRKLRGCSLCQQFIPHWHPEQLDKPLHWRKSKRVFVESMGDPFGDWVTDEQLDQVLDVMADCPQHTFYLLTKQPQNIIEKIYNSACQPPFIFRRALPINVFLGATVDTQSRADSSLKPMLEVVHEGWKTFVSIEPILTHIDPWTVTWADWIIIGAESGRNAAKHQPEREWITDITDFALHFGIPVFLKNSILKLFPDLPCRQEWPA